MIHRNLENFFREGREPDFNRAIGGLCRFYHLKRPRVEWFEYLDWGRAWGKTYEDGTIHLIHPENWKNRYKYNSEHRWINTVYHELGHYVFWANAERKADTFAFRMARGVGEGSAPARVNARRSRERLNGKKAA